MIKSQQKTKQSKESINNLTELISDTTNSTNNTAISDFYQNYGSSQSQNVTVEAGTYNFQIDGVPSYKTTKWYADGDLKETDNSGFWGTDPDFSYGFNSGTTEIKAMIYDDNGNLEETHIWYVTVVKSDIIVGSIDISPSEPDVGENITITANMCNNSDVDAPKFYIAYYYNGYQFDDDNLFWGLNAGNCDPEDSRISFNTPGKYEIKVKADIYNDVDESDENNNELTKTIIVGDPQLCISGEDSHDFGNVEKYQNPNPNSFFFNVENCGGRPLVVNISTNCNWLTVNVNSFELNSNSSRQVIVTANTNDLEVGDYNCNITVSTNGGGISIPTKVTIYPCPAEITTSPNDISYSNSLDFGENEYNPKSLSYQFNIKNTGCDNLTGNITTSSNKISVAPHEFNLGENKSENFNVIITISRPSISSSSFSGWIKINSSVGNLEGSIEISPITDIDENFSLNNDLPQKYYLSSNYPNPFNPTTILRFGLPEESNVKLTVYDVKGIAVANLIVGKRFTAGTYKYQFDGRNLSSGVYFYVLTARSTISEKSFHKTGKMMLIK